MALRIVAVTALVALLATGAQGSVLEQVSGPVLELLCKDTLFPPDDLLLQ